MSEASIEALQRQISQALQDANDNAQTRLDFNYKASIDSLTQAIERLHALVLEIRLTDKEPTT